MLIYTIYKTAGYILVLYIVLKMPFYAWYKILLQVSYFFQVSKMTIFLNSVLTTKKIRLYKFNCVQNTINNYEKNTVL
jgi:hypothetical protein